MLYLPLPVIEHPQIYKGGKTFKKKNKEFLFQL